MSRTKKELLSGIAKDVTTSKIIANNTLRIQYADGTQAVRLHNTDVVTTLADGNIVLDSGGWKCVTTKDRMNCYSPFRVSQSKGVWAVNGQDFYDGITFTPSGELVTESRPVDLASIARQKKVINKFVAQLSKDNLPVPAAGDCLICRFKSDTCLESHLEENYLHGSLLVNAMREKGYDDRQIGLHYSLQIVSTFKRALRQYLGKHLITNAITR